MPNHITNRLEIKGSKKEIKKIIEKFGTYHPATLNKTHDDSLIICKEKNNDDFSVGWFDVKTGIFSRRNEDDILGLPDNWEMEINEAFMQFPDFEKVIPQPDNIFRGDLGQKEKEMCAREGRPTWYSWNIDNWGTKWNSYRCKKEDDNIFIFETAWNSVSKIIETISKKFPSIEFYYEWSSEDTGYNCGYATYKNGLNELNELDKQSKDAYELAFKLRPEDRNYYELINGQYQYKED